MANSVDKKSEQENIEAIESVFSTPPKQAFNSTKSLCAKIIEKVS